MIVQSFGRDGQANLSFTVPHADFERTLEHARRVAKRLGCGGVNSCPKVAKLSVSGIGMRSHTERGDPHVSVAGRGGDQRRYDQHQRSARERGRRRPARKAALAALQKAFADAK